jgi:hypothetical protein
MKTNIIYIGKSGQLNVSLHEKLKSAAIEFQIVSARTPSDFINKLEVQNKSIIIFGGRNIDCWQSIFNNLNSNDLVIYLSTFLGNNFLDSYQSSKKAELYKLKELHKNVTSFNIPFIKELLPPNVSKLINKKKSPDEHFYLTLTSLNSIKESLIFCANNSISDIGIEREYVYLNKRERFIWLLYSKLYQLGNAINSNSILKIIKVLEKSNHVVFRTSGLSSVFIQRSKF